MLPQRAAGAGEPRPRPPPRTRAHDLPHVPPPRAHHETNRETPEHRRIASLPAPFRGIGPSARSGDGVSSPPNSKAPLAPPFRAVDRRGADFFPKARGVDPWEN